MAAATTTTTTTTTTGITDSRTRICQNIYFVGIETLLPVLLLLLLWYKLRRTHIRSDTWRRRRRHPVDYCARSTTTTIS